MNTNTIVAIVLGVLVLVSAVQAFQLSGMKEKVSDGQLSVASASVNPQAPASPARTGSLPTSVKNLPQMVGGC